MIGTEKTWHSALSLFLMVIRLEFGLQIDELYPVGETIFEK